MNFRDHQKLQIGSVSTALLENLKPILIQEMDAIISRMKSNFRAGKLNDFASDVAALCAIEDVESNLRSKIESGNRVREKQNG